MRFQSTPTNHLLQVDHRVRSREIMKRACLLTEMILANMPDSHVDMVFPQARRIHFLADAIPADGVVVGAVLVAGQPRLAYT